MKVFVPWIALALSALIGHAASARAQMMGGPTPEHLGRMLFFDPGLSANGNQSCATCHGASAGFTGPNALINAHGAVYEGSFASRFGNRRPPSAAYAMLAPRFDYDPTRGFFGGNFSDGRATGWLLGTALADQAQGPFVNPLEQALPSGADVVARVCAAHYGRMFRRVWGARVCSDANAGYAAIARSLAAFESSAAVSPYSSKFDAVLAGSAQLSALEQQGRALFEGKAGCASCHPSARDAQGNAPAFSQFGYANLGVPANPENPFYAMHRVTIENVSVNPLGLAWVDPGLAGFIEQLAASDSWRGAAQVSEGVRSLSAATLSALAQANRGKHRVPTLRNVDLRPAPDFTKAYTHNGYFKTLEGLVHFLNTRDVLPRCSSLLMEAQALAAGCWPAPEVAANVETRSVGKLGLTPQEEAAIVAFLRALSDSASTGGCMMGGCGMGGMGGMM